MLDVDNLLSIEEAAIKLRCSPASVRLWLSQGRLRRTKVATRTLIARTDLEEFVRASTAAAEAKAA